MDMKRSKVLNLLKMKGIVPRKLLSALLVTALTITGFSAIPLANDATNVYAATEGGFTYNIESAESGEYGYGAYITGYSGGKNIAVPAILGGAPVVSVEFYFSIGSLDISRCLELRELDCTNNELTKLDVSKNTKLLSLSCGLNNLTVLDVRNNAKLEFLGCSNNNIKTLDVSRNTALMDLYCSDNRLAVLNVSNNKALILLNCENNQLTNLNVRNNKGLNSLDCSDNRLTTLDISTLEKLKDLNCAYNFIADESLLTAFIDRYGERNILPQYMSFEPRISVYRAKTAKIKNVQWTGKQIRPSVTVTTGGAVLKEGADYAVSYGSNKKIGKGTVTVTGTGKYAGAKAVTFNIIPKKMSISKLALAYRRIETTWTKAVSAQKITKVQLSYRLKGSKKWKIKNISPKASAYTLKKLKGAKAYQVRIRAYKTVDGRKYYSPWSDMKTSGKVY
jgi:hypothetical protein